MKKILFLLICCICLLKDSSTYAQKDTLKYGINLSYMTLGHVENSFLFPNIIVGYGKHALFLGTVLNYDPLFDFHLKNQYAFQGGYQYLVFSKHKIRFNTEIAVHYSKSHRQFYVDPRQSPSSSTPPDPNKVGKYGKRTSNRLGLFPGVNINWKLKHNLFLNQNANIGLSRDKSFWDYDDPTLEDDTFRTWHFNLMLKFGLGYNF